MIETNNTGGKQSKIQGRCTEIPPVAMIELSKVMGEGSVAYPREENGTPNWHRIDSYSNLDHAMEHAFNFLIERNSPESSIKKMREELGHFAARAAMALEMFIKEIES